MVIGALAGAALEATRLSDGSRLPAIRTVELWLVVADAATAGAARTAAIIVPARAADVRFTSTPGESGARLYLVKRGNHDFVTKVLRQVALWPCSHVGELGDSLLMNTEQLRIVAEFASLAPSVHNTQPWQ